MPAWAWSLIAIAVVALALVVSRRLADRRTRSLRDRFGPEYDQTLDDAQNKREAESELAARAERRALLEIAPLPPGARERYVSEWQRVQARFVDDPAGAAREADMLIQAVMEDRGYPIDDFDQRAADVSVDHPRAVEAYREAQRLTRASALGDAEARNDRAVLRGNGLDLLLLLRCRYRHRPDCQTRDQGGDHYQDFLCRHTCRSLRDGLMGCYIPDTHFVRRS